ncbi:uncharacterized protein PRCAT00004810001 [Priceomyces carsonii]|uniref:uncharacterized protein n=1 Tax=Priceomyces carsonii TaxID=28549 RepID=UPI002ED839D4|nr:unnamed protein product [Priceomyces carsonii]
MFRPLIQLTRLNLGIARFSTKHMWRPLSQTSHQFASNITVRTSNRAGLKLLGCVTGALGFASFLNRSSAVLNETYRSSGSLGGQVQADVTRIEKSAKTSKSRFGGKLNYQELCIGSVTGLFLGIIAGKLSSVIVFLTLSSYLLLQFLQSRDIITIPWKKMINVGSESIDIRTLVFEKLSFKISFVSSFLIAAFNV